MVRLIMLPDSKSTIAPVSAIRTRKENMSIGTQQRQNLRSAQSFLFSIVVLILGCIASTRAQAQQWTGILDPSRAIDWSAYAPGVTGGIPNRTTICTTLNSGATAAQINSAISSCPSGQVVFLNAGTYNVGGITFGGKSSVTLRGAGADQTLIVFTGTASCGLTASLCIWSGDFSDRDHVENTANWTAGYSKGTTVITLDNVTNLAVGSLILLDQCDDGFTTSGCNTGAPSDNGDIFVCATLNVCTGQGGHNATRNNRGQIQLNTVKAINGFNVTLSQPLTMPNWRSGQSPQAWWPNTIVHDDGVENLSLDNRGGTVCSTCANIIVFNARNIWLKGVRSIEPNGSGGSPLAAHVWANEATQTTVRDSYFYGSDNSSQSYGIRGNVSSFLLVENNIFQHVTSPVVLDAPDTGTVVGYNFSIDDNYTANGTAPQWMQPDAAWHEVGEAMELWEGNSGLGLDADNIHGTHHLGTFFRNHYYGDIWNNPTKSNNTMLMQLQAYSRFFNFIGNVLGRSGYYNTYEGCSPTSIFCLSGNTYPGVQYSRDARVAATTMRWGNYDTVTGTSRFLASEVPSGITNFSNPVPTTQTLPSSFYLNAQPSWWSFPSGTAAPFPGIGPDVTGGNGPAGHSYYIPAENCWYNVMGGTVGSSNLLSFNAKKCYGSGTVALPAPPSGLQAVVY